MADHAMIALAGDHGRFTATEAVWKHLEGGKAVSIVRPSDDDDAYLTLRLRRAGERTFVLVEHERRFLQVGEVEHRRFAISYRRFQELPRGHEKVVATERLINDYLSVGILPVTVELVPGEVFELRRLRHFEADHPEVHSWLIAHAGKPGSFAHNLLVRLRQFGALSERELQHVQRLIARQGKRPAPAPASKGPVRVTESGLPVTDKEPRTPAERRLQEVQRRQDEEIRRNRERREGRLKDDD
jgi:hypothetical protein